MDARLLAFGCCGRHGWLVLPQWRIFLLQHVATSKPERNSSPRERIVSSNLNVALKYFLD